MEKKLKAKHAGNFPFIGHLNTLAMMATPEATEQERLERERKAAEQLEQEKQDSAYEAQSFRQLERIKRWAMKQPRDHLAEQFSLAVLLLMETRKTSRARGEAFDKLTDVAQHLDSRAKAMQSVARDSIHKEFVQTEARRKGAIRKLANDPKQVAKARALELWNERRAGKHPNLRTVEQYATEVMRRCRVLESSKVICGWSAKWTKQVKAGETPSC